MKETMDAYSASVVNQTLLHRLAVKPTENEEILERLNDDGGWKFVLDRHCDDIYDILRKMMYTVNEDDLGDMFLFAFQRLSMNDGRKLKQFQGKAKFKTWLTAVVRNLARDWVRMKKRRELPVGPILERTDKDGAPLRFEPEDQRSDPEIAIEERRLFHLLESAREELNAAIDRLDDATKAVCKLWFFDRLGAREIARIMGLESDRQVYQTTGKILRELAVDLENKGFDAGRMREMFRRMDA